MCWQSVAGMLMKNNLCCCSYATVYTNFPVFSLVLDKDVSPEIAMTYPELYKELTKVLHRQLNFLDQLFAGFCRRIT